MFHRRQGAWAKSATGPLNDRPKGLTTAMIVGLAVEIPPPKACLSRYRWVDASRAPGACRHLVLEGRHTKLGRAPDPVLNLSVKTAYAREIAHAGSRVYQIQRRRRGRGTGTGTARRGTQCSMLCVRRIVCYWTMPTGSLAPTGDEQQRACMKIGLGK